jgi:hypothetical protein
VQFACRRVDRVRGGARGPADLGLGPGVIAGHPLGKSDAHDAVAALVAEPAGVVGDGAALGQHLVVGEYGFPPLVLSHL